MRERPSSIKGILIGGCVAGIVDIFAACMITHLSLPTLLRVIASGLLGESAATGGLMSAAIGLGLQLAMSVLIAAICVNVARCVPTAQPHWTIAGIVYGLAIFAVMNYIVMPLSAVGRIPHFSVASFIKNLLAMLLFGLIVAFFTRMPRSPQAQTRSPHQTTGVGIG